MCKFRDLKADEIEVRVGMCSEKGVSLLLYKDARCDMAILDETVGSMNWQRRHTRDNANCIVEIWDAEKAQWISKEDVGTESNTEKEKGQASDSFKRACVNWGIGRELYTAPFIWVSAQDCNMKQNNGRWSTNDKFSVNDIEIENKRIIKLAISNDKTGEVVYTYGYGGAKRKSSKKKEEPAPVPIPEQPIPQPVICPRCKKPVQPVKRGDGTTATPAEILKGCGMCYPCYQASKAAYQNNI